MRGTRDRARASRAATPRQAHRVAASGTSASRSPATTSAGIAIRASIGRRSASRSSVERRVEHFATTARRARTAARATAQACGGPRRCPAPAATGSAAASADTRRAARRRNARASPADIACGQPSRATKRRRRRHQDQPPDALRTSERPLQRDLAAERPAEQRQRRIDVGGRVGRCVAASVRQSRSARPVPTSRVPAGRRHARDGASRAPARAARTARRASRNRAAARAAVRRRRTRCGRGYRARSHDALTLAAAPLRSSHRARDVAQCGRQSVTSDCECAADSEMRSRAVPAGTVGGRIAGTRMPRARSASETATRRRDVADHERLDRRRRRQQRPRQAAGAAPGMTR